MRERTLIIQRDDRTVLLSRDLAPSQTPEALRRAVGLLKSQAPVRHGHRACPICGKLYRFRIGVLKHLGKAHDVDIDDALKMA